MVGNFTIYSDRVARYEPDSHYWILKNQKENIETWISVIICVIVSDIIASVSLNSYAKSLRGQAEMAYTNYMFPTQNSYYANQAYATTWICPNCNSVCQMHSAYCTKCGTVKR